jgi:hypothetical protein
METAFQGEAPAFSVRSDHGGVGGVAMQASEDELFQEWVESWAEETGQGIPCREAQADGAPCFELGRDCAECEKAFQVWLELRREREGRGAPSS